MTLRVNQTLAKTAAGVNYPPARPPRLIQIVAPFSSRLSRDNHAADHAEVRKIDPSILLKARLYPNMYNLTRQVGEAIGHAVVAKKDFLGTPD